MPELTLSRASVDIGGRRILDSADLALGAGELVTLLGANGAGKSTLLRAALGFMPLAGGAARLAGRDPGRMRAHERALHAAYLPQMRPLAWPLLVRDVVALGRFTHGAAFGKLKSADFEAIARAMSACELTALAHRRTDTLSGGELARVHVARALAGEAPLLIADEPTAALDPLHAWRVMDVIARFVARGGAALVVLHDIALAARFATRVCLMKDGRLIADGPPADALASETLKEAFGIRASVSAVEGAHSIVILGPA